jgi:small subunit ribosomal protein S20
LANHKSAKKRARQDVKRAARNKTSRTRVKSVVKSARIALASGDADAAATAVRAAEGAVRRVASKGAIPKKRASRITSRLAKRRNTLSS